MKNCCRQVLPAAVFCVRSWFAQFARAIPFAKNAALLLFRCCAAPFAHEMALPSWISLSIFSCKHEICLWDPPASHHSQKRSFAAFSLLRSSFLLMKWRSFRRSPQASFHASMKSACGDLRVNCVLHFIQGFENFALSQMGKML